jgi:hypothetical protein
MNIQIVSLTPQISARTKRYIEHAPVGVTIHHITLKERKEQLYVVLDEIGDTICLD